VPAFQTGDPSLDSNASLQDMVWSLFGSVGSETQAQFFGKAGNRTADDLRGLRQQEFNAFVQDSFRILCASRCALFLCVSTQKQTPLPTSSARP